MKTKLTALLGERGKVLVPGKITADPKKSYSLEMVMDENYKRLRKSVYWMKYKEGFTMMAEHLGHKRHVASNRARFLSVPGYGIIVLTFALVGK